ncbi:MAG: TonB-dependent receptor [Bryobacterales bacterium]
MQARSPWARLCLALLAHALSALALFGQGGTAQLVGRVTDPSGAVIPGASVTLTNVGSGVAQTAQTGPQGYYRFPLLPPGNYEIAVQSEGFRRVAQTGIKLDVEQAATLDVELEVGQITETVQVTAAPPLLEGENATVGQVVENKSIVEMPLNGRSAWNLVQLAGATTFIKGIGDAGEIPVATVAGSRAFTQGLYIDGGSVQKSGLNRSMAELAPMVDAVEEFKVITNGYSAEFGRSAGGVFSAVTKSGTNEFHGNLFEFFRNDKMDARNFFSIDKPRLRYNQYGGTLGGPIIKDKTHFFIAYEGTRTSTGSVFVGTMPTPAMHEGDFSGIVDSQGRSLQLYDPLTTQPDPSDPTRQVRDPFANNQIPTSRFDPVAAKVATFYPGPNQAGNRAGANNFNVNVTPKRRQDHGTIKIDHQLTQKDRIFGRYIGQYNFRPQVSVFPNPDANSVGPSTRSIGNLAHTFAGGWTRTISPRVVNDLKISYLKQFRDLSHSSLGKDWPSQLGLTGVDELSFPRFRPAGYTSVGGTANVYRVQRGPTMMLSDSITYLTGRHQMKAGFEFRWNGTTDQFRVLPSGDFVHPQQGTGLQGVTASGNGYATFLTGFTANANIRDSPALTFRSQYYGFFVQDDWKITPKLTLNIGVRYDVETPRISPDNNSNGFDMQAINPVAHRPGVVTFAGVDGEPRRTYNFDKNNIAPRFGFAYRMFGGKTVLRGGYGIFFGNPDDQGQGAGPRAALGFATEQLITSPDQNQTPSMYLAQGYPAFTPPGPETRTAAFGVGSGVQFFERNRRTPYSQQFNLGIQQQIKGVLLEAQYLGNLGRKLTGNNININQPLPELVGQPGSIQSRRPFSQFTAVNLLSPNFGMSSYNALLLRAEKRYENGLQFLWTYTYSHMIDNVDAIAGGDFGGTPGSGYQNYYNRRLDYATSPLDIKHNVTFNVVYDLPWGPNRKWLTKGPASAILGGWQLSVLSTIFTGPVYGVTTQQNSCECGSTGPQRADILRDPTLEKSQRTVERWFDTDAFAQPERFTFGNASRSVGRAPAWPISTSAS